MEILSRRRTQVYDGFCALHEQLSGRQSADIAEVWTTKDNDMLSRFRVTMGLLPVYLTLHCTSQLATHTRSPMDTIA